MLLSSDFVSTVDIVYPAFPLFLFAGHDILKSLMEPILRYTASGNYPSEARFAISRLCLRC
jgi:hypothetical protein